MTLKTTILISLLFPVLSYANNGVNDEDCALKRHFLSDLSGISRMLCSQAIDRFKEGRQTQENVEMICGNTHNVAWRRNSDNSMSDANDKPARAMGLIRSMNGTSTSVQVCPGVYLATAHGALDNPNRDLKEGEQKHRSPIENLSAVFAFPLSAETRMSISSDEQFISPRLRDPSLWRESSKENDYVFIKVDNPVRPNDFLPPLDYESEELLQASNDGSLDVELRRPKTRYEIGEDGLPVTDQDGVFDKETLVSGRDLVEHYQSPQKVNRRCEVFEKTDGLMSNDCPSETGVSGSPYSAKIGGNDYLLGLHASSSGNIIVDENTKSFGTFIKTKQFCEDYKSVCGQPCSSLKDTLSQQNSVSI